MLQIILHVQLACLLIIYIKSNVTSIKLFYIIHFINISIFYKHYFNKNAKLSFKNSSNLIIILTIALRLCRNEWSMEVVERNVQYL